jgi:DNA-binding response OmpR family regulator
MLALGVTGAYGGTSDAAGIVHAWCNGTMTKGRILLAHGNTDCQTIYGSALAHDGYHVDIAGDGDSALRQLASQSYDVVVADLYLESTDDECLLRRLRREPFSAHLPVVVLTGWATEAHRRVAIDEDADEFLPLPTSPRELIGAVGALLGKPRRRTPATGITADPKDRTEDLSDTR